MRRLLLDTHIWLWYVAGAGDLAAGLRDAIDAATGTCWLSPISMWEVGVLDSQGRVRLAEGYQTWLEGALAAFPIREAPINIEVARRVQSLDLAQSDPADRFLAATALVYDLTLVTVDRHLCEASWLLTLTG